MTPSDSVPECRSVAHASAPSTRREPELPDEDWPEIGWRQYLAVAFLIVALVVAVCVA